VDFTLLRSARPVRGRHLWLRSVPDAHMGECRVAYAIGRPVGTAVARNRLRRRLRALAVAAAAAGRLPIGAHLIGARASAATASYGELSADLDRILPPAATGSRS
jgi:ribonuclease P protein component